MSYRHHPENLFLLTTIGLFYLLGLSSKTKSNQKTKRRTKWNAPEKYIVKTKLKANGIVSKEEREALFSLKNNKTIVINKADKSNIIVYWTNNSKSKRHNSLLNISCKLKSQIWKSCATAYITKLTRCIYRKH